MPALDGFNSAATPFNERERQILEHLPQVALIARKIHQHIQGRLDLEDLISAGTLGLIAAVDRFDSSRQLKLKTYAEYRIRGAMLDSLRSLDGVNRADRKRAKEIISVAGRLEQGLHRPVTHEEIANEMNLSVRECSDALSATEAGALLSLDAKLGFENGTATFAEVTPDRESPSPEQAFAESEIHRVVSDAIAALPPVAQRVITMHYAQGLTMRKIAPMLQLSEWQVQETRRRAVTELRDRLEPFGLIRSAA